MSSASSFTVRPGTRADLPGLVEVITAAFRVGYRDLLDDATLERADADRWRAALDDPRSTMDTEVAVDADGRIIAFARFGPDPETASPQAGYLASLYVHPDASGRGVGARLLQRVADRLAAAGRSQIRLWVFRDNPRARGLYERAGFVVDGREMTDPEWGVPQVGYVRRLDGAASADRASELVTVASPTEERNPRTQDIDTVPVLTLLQRLNDEDARVAGEVRRVLPALAQLVELTVDRLAAGGRVHYFGAGSSGRLGLLDAAELPPTFGVSPDLFIAHLAGGDLAVRVAQEGAEDDRDQGAREAETVGPEDVVIGLASSGYTPYVGGALERARAAGAHTALVTSNPRAPLAALCDTVLCVATGPEAITGSTRLKSATAQKLVLNTFSTAVMVRTGRTWSNLMVNLAPTNAKLRGRVLRLLTQATGEAETTCERALADAGQEPRTALVCLLAGVDPAAARAALAAHGNRVALALRALGAG